MEVVKKILARYKTLPIKTRQLLIIGTTLALVAALPLFVWGILTQRFDLRKRASTGEPPVKENPVSWSTPSVSLNASNFYMDINGKTYLNNAKMTLNSDPPNNTDPDFTTLELQWVENDVPMRLYLYFRLDGNVWSLYDTRTYDGKIPGDWLFYNQEASIAIDKIGLSPNSKPVFELRTADGENLIRFENLVIVLPGILYPTPTPSGTPLPPTPKVCPTPPPCDGILLHGDPRDGSCAFYTCIEDPTPPPSARDYNFQLKLGGVEGDEAEGTKATFRFVSGALNFVTTPVELTYKGNGIYWAFFRPAFQNQLTKLGAGGNGYTIYVKGEKHLANKFCFNTGQTGSCTGQGTITIPDPVETATPTFIFTGFPLEPGDLPPQDGKVDSSDFNTIKTLMGKLCGNLSDTDLTTADLDYNGCINIRDAFLLKKTLETRYDEF